MNHLEAHGILTDYQHGFRAGRSCETQLIITVHDLLMAADVGDRVDIAFLDFSKAFDTVPHKRLLSKLDHYGVRGDMKTWIGSFLQHRTQQVVIEGSKSDQCTVDSGVPQGSVMGPILFLVFINDLPSNVRESTCRLFADDCLLYRKINSVEDANAMQRDLTALEQWTKKWGMSFNASKCYIVSTAKTGAPYHYQLNDQILTHQISNPYLGVEIQDDLTFTIHISKITKKASSKLGFIRRNLKGCPERLKELAYFALVRSGIEYASTVWDPILQKDIMEVEKIQRSAARVVKNEYRRGPEISITALIEELGWDSLQERRKNARLCMLYKAANGVVALPQEYLITQDKRTRGGNSSNFKHIRAKKKQSEQSFVVRTIPEWNGLPVDSKGAPTLETFKARLHRRD